MMWEILDSTHKEQSFSNSHLFLWGDNLAIMNTGLNSFENEIKTAYIDPPYNTGTDVGAFSYANKIGDDAWIEYIENRVKATHNLLSDDGLAILTIDDQMVAELRVLCNEIFGKKNFIATIPISIKPGGRTNDSIIAVEHEYLLIYAKDRNKASGNLWPESEKTIKSYKRKDENGFFKMRDFMRTGGHSYPVDRPNSFYCVRYNENTKEMTPTYSLKDYMLSNSIDDFTEDLIDKYVSEIDNEFSKENCLLIYPIDSKSKFRIWRRTIPSIKYLIDNQLIEIRKEKKKPPSLRIKDYQKKGVLPRSMWTNSKYDATTYGTKLLKKIIGNNEFSYPKSLNAVKDILQIFLSNDEDNVVLDIFGGSGTTNHAILEINKQHNRKHKCITIEQESYIENVAYKRNVIVNQTEKYAGNNESIILAKFQQ